MTLKAIEMQVALPRTHDAGKLQEQIQQRGRLEQDHAAHEVKKEDEKKRHEVQKEEQKGRPSLSDDGSRGNKDFHQHPGDKKKQRKEAKEKHPYKGGSIDYSG